MKLKWLLLIILLLFIIILIPLYLWYEDNLMDNLYCNNKFTILAEPIIDGSERDVNFKYYTWESEKTDCHWGNIFIYRTLQFISDTTALIYRRGVSLNSFKFFTLNYIFDNITYASKKYELYKVEGDTIFKLIQNSKDSFYLDLYYYKDDPNWPLPEPPEIIGFKPYKEYAIYKIENDVLYLSSFKKEDLN